MVASGRGRDVEAEEDQVRIETAAERGVLPFDGGRIDFWYVQPLLAVWVGSEIHRGCRIASEQLAVEHHHQRRTLARVRKMADVTEFGAVGPQRLVGVQCDDRADVRAGQATLEVDPLPETAQGSPPSGDRNVAPAQLAEGLIVRSE